MKNMRKIIAVFIATIMMLSVVGISVSAKQDTVLKFNENGKFKIMLVADIHCTDQMYPELTEFLNRTLDDEKPDFVIFMGDNVKGYWDACTLASVKSAIEQFTEPVESRNIPFTAIFGNHDYQTLVPKFVQEMFYKRNSNCIMNDDFTMLHRRANQSILIKDSKGENYAYNLWMLDSGTKDAEEKLMPVFDQQINWYKETCSKLTAENDGKTVPSLVFQHIPIFEVEELFKEVDKDTEDALKCGNLEHPGYYVLKDGVSGHLNNSPKVPYTNTGEYDAFVEMKDVKGVFFAHDHTNDYCGITEDGIMLAATTTSGFQSSGINELRGVRIIELDENNPEEICTYQVYYEDYKDASWSNGNYPEQKKDYDIELKISMFWEYLIYMFK